VARALWTPRPDFRTAAAAWLYGGGAHHTAFSQGLQTEHLEDYAEIAGIELFAIGADSRLGELRKELRWNEAFYRQR
jgi:L-arabinose isomerase